MSWRDEANQMDENMDGDNGDEGDWKKRAEDLDDWRKPTETSSSLFSDDSPRDNNRSSEFSVMADYEKENDQEQKMNDMMSEIESDRLDYDTEKSAKKNEALGKLVDAVLKKDTSLDQKMAAHDQELEVQNAEERHRQKNKEIQKQAAAKAKQEFILSCQQQNELGMMYGSEAQPTSAKSSAKSQLDGIDANPPVYSESELYKSEKPIADTSFWPTEKDFEKRSDFARCDTCFDPIQVNIERGFCGRANRKKNDIYHSECFNKSGALPCDYCGVPLMADSEKNLCGKWGVFNSKKFHIECYQLFAGPRCGVCFDVIFANQAKRLSGKWIKTKKDGELLHEECYHNLLERLDKERDTSQRAQQRNIIDATLDRAEMRRPVAQSNNGDVGINNQIDINELPPMYSK